MTIHLITPANGATVNLHTPLQDTFTPTANDTSPQAAFDYLHLHRQGEDCSLPVPVSCTWESDIPCGSYLLHLSTDEQFAMETTVPVASNHAEVANLTIGQTYYWKVTGWEGEICLGTSPVYRFATDARAPRWLAVEGLSNVRDMGGWDTCTGKKIRQGLLYRGCEMEFHHTLTEAGRETMRNTLKIRTDLDLRGEAVGKVEHSAIGCDHALIPCAAYGDFLRDKETCRRIFALLADENRYPVYFHCWGGADRTGTVAFLLGGLLGMSVADLYRDYTLTSLSIWGERRLDSPLFRSLVEGLGDYGFAETADTAVSACRAYLADCGVTEEEMERICRILVG